MAENEKFKQSRHTRRKAVPIKTNYQLFKRRLVLKCMGEKEWIEKFCSYINRLFSPEKITFSPILFNKGEADYEYFCFINIIMEDTGDPEQQ